MIPHPRETKPAPALPGGAVVDPPRPATKSAVVCAVCRTPCRREDLAMVANKPTCVACRARQAQRRMPRWVPVAGCVLAALLGVGLLRGGRWLQAGARMLRAQRLAEDGRWHEAAPDLDAALAEVPECSEAQLLRIQAAVQGDDAATVERLVVELRLAEQTGERARSVQALVDKYRSAHAAYTQAMTHLQRNRIGPAVGLLERAHAEFPDSHKIHLQLLTCQAASRFERGDWDGYLDCTRRAAELAPEDPLQQAMVASALAAQFVATGKSEFKERCEAQLTRAESLCRTARQRRDLTEYREQVLRQMEPALLRRGRR